MFINTIVSYRPLPYEAPGSMMLSDLSPANEERDVYETIEADHEYEILDKYNQPQYDDVEIPPPKPEPVEAEAVHLQPSVPSTGDYESGGTTYGGGLSMA